MVKLAIEGGQKEVTQILKAFHKVTENLETLIKIDKDR